VHRGPEGEALDYLGFGVEERGEARFHLPFGALLAGQPQEEAVMA